MRTTLEECLHHIADGDSLSALVKLDQLDNASLADAIKNLASSKALIADCEIKKALTTKTMAYGKRAVRNVKRRLLAALLHKAGIIALADSKGMRFNIMVNLANNYLNKEIN